MTTLPNGFSYHAPHRDRHWFFAAVAFLFSAALHVGLLYWMQDLRLDASELAEQARSEQEERNRLLPPLRVERMPQDPLRPTFSEQPSLPAPAQAAALDLARVLAPHPDLVSPLPPAPAAQPPTPCRRRRAATSTRWRCRSSRARRWRPSWNGGSTTAWRR